MKLRYAICVGMLAMGLAGAAPADGSPQARQLPALDGYKLVWADEFDRDGAPDPANWTFETGFKRNAEMQWYQPENAFVEKGLLVIEGRRERKPNPTFGDPAQRPEFAKRKFINFTSASVSTEGRQSWLYGRFEIRARIRTEQGLWPAIWTLGEKGTWPAKGEVDILEYYQHSILANFAWAEKGPKWPQWQGRKVPMAELTDDPDWDKRFHVWTMDWTEKEITLWLDGRLMNRLDLDAVNSHPGSGVKHPFRQPHYLLLNLALGGGNGGPLKDTAFPSRYEIDYVRVYQHKDEKKQP